MWEDVMYLHMEEGWLGMFTRDQVEGALANGTRIVKVKMDPGDARNVGATGTVLGSIRVPDMPIGYFIEWDQQSRHAVFCVEWKIEPVGRTH